MTDDESFDEFYGASRDRLVIQVAAVAGGRAEAADFVQEAFIRAWIRWDRIGKYDDPEAWVRRVAFNLAVSRWRKLRNLHPFFSEPVQELGFDDEQLLLVDALKTLPTNQRRAIVLHYLADLSVDEISSELTVPSGTVKSWLSRGRAHLEELLLADREEVQ